jgi:hypothetical protein
MKGEAVRRLILGGSGAIFGVIALAAIVAPRVVAAQYGLTLDFAAMNEFRAEAIAGATVLILRPRRSGRRAIGEDPRRVHHWAYGAVIQK